MPKLASEIVELLKSNIGGREQGTVGTTNIDILALNAVNGTISTIVKRQNDIPELQRDATLTLTSTECTYDIPVADVDNEVIRVKSIAAFTATIPGSTVFFNLDQLNIRRFNSAYHARFPTLLSRPAFYAIWGNKIEINTYPNQTYNCLLRVNTWPTVITINQAHPLADEWDSVIEAGATALLFLALQQTEDHDIWTNVFEARMKETLHALREQPDLNISRGPDLNGRLFLPQFDPFVKRM